MRKRAACCGFREAVTHATHAPLSAQRALLVAAAAIVAFCLEVRLLNGSIADLARVLAAALAIVILFAVTCATGWGLLLAARAASAAVAHLLLRVGRGDKRRARSP